MKTSFDSFDSFNRLFQNMTQPWVVISYVLLATLSFIYLDKPVALWCQSLDWSTSVAVLKGFTLLGYKTMYLMSLPVLALIFRYVFKHKTWACRTWFLWLCVFVPNAVAFVLKIVFGRARPELFLHAQTYGFQWMRWDHVHHSFPSGHTATIMGLVFGLWIIIPRYRWLFLCMGVAVGLSRIFLLQHYLSDVLIAAYLALIEIWIIQYVLQRYTPTFIQTIHGDKQ